MRSWGLWVVLVILAALHSYIGVQILPDLPVEAGWRWLGVVVLLLSVALIPFSFLRRRRPDTRQSEILVWAGLLFMGFSSSLLVLTVLRDLMLLLVGWVSSPDAASLMAAYSAVAVPLIALAFSLVGLVNARKRARVVEVDIPISDLPLPLQGFSIAQISDIHVGPTIKRGYLDTIVDAVNALEPHLVAITGDLVDGSVRSLSSHTSPLARLRSRHGAYFVTGNHEYYSGANAWIAELRRLGLNVLMNEHVVLDHQGAKLVIAGVTDFTAHHFEADHKSCPRTALNGAPDAPKVLLAHQPRSAFAAADAGFDLQLSGHTHGGQFVPWNFFVRLQQPFTAGLNRMNALWVYTSRGTGYWGPPKRLGAPSEITLLRLVRA